MASLKSGGEMKWFWLGLWMGILFVSIVMLLMLLCDDLCSFLAVLIPIAYVCYWCYYSYRSRRRALLLAVSRDLAVDDSNPKSTTGTKGTKVAPKVAPKSKGRGESEVDTPTISAYRTGDSLMLILRSIGDLPDQVTKVNLNPPGSAETTFSTSPVPPAPTSTGAGSTGVAVTTGEQ